MRVSILILILLGSIIGACAQIPFGYSTKSKKAIKLFEKGRNAPSEFLDQSNGRPNYEAGIKIIKQAISKAP